MTMNSFSVKINGTQMAGLIWRPPGTKIDKKRPLGLRADRPPLLALHGWLDNAASFHFLAAEMNQPVIALDFVGHGHSAHAAGLGGYSIWDYAFQLHLFYKFLQTPKIGLVGHSLGAGVSMIWSATFPECVSRMALLDGYSPYVVVDGDTASHLRNACEVRLSRTYRQRVFKSVREAVERRQSASEFKVSKEGSELLVRRNLRKSAKGWQWRFDPRVRLPSLMRLSEGQLLNLLSRVEAPTLCMLGKQGFIRPEWVEAHVKSIKNVTISYAPGGHHFHLEPDVTPWIDQLRSWFE